MDSQKDLPVLIESSEPGTSKNVDEERVYYSKVYITLAKSTNRCSEIEHKRENHKIDFQNDESGEALYTGMTNDYLL